CVSTAPPTARRHCRALHDALPISGRAGASDGLRAVRHTNRAGAVTGGDEAERTADILEKIGRVGEDRLEHAALRLELLDQQHRLTVEVYAVVKLSPSDRSDEHTSELQ